MQKINLMKNELVFKKIGAVCNYCNSYSPIGTIRMNIEIDLDDNFNFHLSQDTLVDNPFKDYSNSNIEFIEYGITIDIEECKIIPNFNSISCIYTQNIKDFLYNTRRFIEEIL